MTSLAEYLAEFRRLSKRLEESLQEMRTQGIVEAEKEREYRRAQALAFAEAPQGTVDERKAWVQAETAELRYQRDVAAVVARSASKSVDVGRVQISALQSFLSAHRAEANLGAFGPPDGP